MKQKVFITRLIPQQGIDILKEHFEVSVFPEKRPIKKKELKRLAKGCVGLIPLLTDRVDAEIMDKTGIKAISNFAVGVDNVDIEAATARKIPVMNTPGVLTNATADLTFSLILGTARRLVEADNYFRTGKWNGWDPLLLLGGDVSGKTLGIVGLGRIGKAVAERAKGFGMEVIYNSRAKFQDDERLLGIKFVSLKELLKKSDFVTLHTPYTEATHHLIGRKELELMKPSAYLINTARGQIINEEELIEGLQEGLIAGAGLDVYYAEPKFNKELAKLTNVILLPHIGSASLETRTNMAIIAAENLKNALFGNRPAHIINPEIYD
ncbi:MAG: D-glycerate dehydrogenase [Candidatus Heimdallarchaeota archaeon]|nr:D-glycerate dehydrogenase [Candidatus Heimdallarchaeota archaeon]MCK4771060.1 D-glycerate dehydrogenase [Candidatus Heimdallarchaeota archaeon]